ncbi:MAG: hypothetical protein KIT31_15230 [Deltaproteobacteria bacterium]|nr:hypothetical protein [Deltaproteobacteria bacterium]
MHRALVVMLLLGCGGSKEEAAQKEKAEKAEKPDKPAKAEPPAKKPAAELFTGAAVALPAPVAKLRLEMAEADARAAAPEVFAKQYGYEVPGFDKVKLHVQLQGGRVASIRAEIAEPVAAVKAWLAKQWGEPKAVKEAHVWSAPSTGLRAKLEGSERSANLYFSQVQSLDQLLGTEGKQFGFEKAPLIGTRRDDLMKAFAAYRPTPRAQDPDSITMTLPAIEASEYTSSLDVRVKRDVVTGFTLQINFGDDQAVNAAIVKRLEAMYGKPTANDMYLTFPGPPPAKAEIRKDAGFPDVIWVGDYRK